MPNNRVQDINNLGHIIHIREAAFVLGEASRPHVFLQIRPRLRGQVLFRLRVTACDPALKVRESSQLLAWQDAAGHLTQEIQAPVEGARLAFDPAVLLDYESDVVCTTQTGFEVDIDEISSDEISGGDIQHTHSLKLTFSLAPYQVKPADIDAQLVPRYLEPADGQMFYPDGNNDYAPCWDLQMQSTRHYCFMPSLHFTLHVKANSVGRAIAVQLNERADTEQEYGAEQTIECTWRPASNPTWRSPIALLFGTQKYAIGRPNPPQTAMVAIDVRMTYADDSSSSLSGTLTLKSEDKAPYLQFDVRSVTEKNASEISFPCELTRHGVTSTYPLVPLTLQLARAIQPQQTVFSLRLQLKGRIASEVATKFGLSANWQDEQGQCYEDVVSLSDARYDNGILCMTDAEPSARIDVLIAVNKIPEHAKGKLVVCLRAKNGIQITFEREVMVKPVPNDRYVAFDLGASSISVAMAIGGEPTKSLPLSDVIKHYDIEHDEKGTPFISSQVGLGLAQHWRSQSTQAHALHTLWARVQHCNPVSAEAAATCLQRTYSTAVPLISKHFGCVAGVSLMSPKMLLMAPSAYVEVDSTKPVWRTDGQFDAKVDVQAMIADVLDELGEFYLPAVSDVRDAVGANIILTHPTRYGSIHKTRLRHAAKKVCARLGVSSRPRLIPESDAAAAFFLNRLPEYNIQKPHKIMVFDLGAGTLDLTLAEMAYAGEDNAGAVPTSQTIVRRIGAGVGGDSIDLILYFVVDEALKRYQQQPVDFTLAGKPYRLLVRHDFLQPHAGDEGHLRAKRLFSQAIRQAKGVLTEDCRRKTANGLYHWPENTYFKVAIGKIPETSIPWAVSVQPVTQAQWRQDGQQKQTWTAYVDSLNSLDKSNITLPIGLLGLKNKTLWLALPKNIVNCNAMQKLMHFLTQTVIDKSFSDPVSGMRERHLDTLLISGRASLWPLVYEGLERMRQRLNPNLRFAMPQPPQPAALKEAVAEGAIELARSPDYTDIAGETSAIGLLVWRPERKELSGRAIINWFEITENDQRVFVSHRISVMLAPPGISAEELQNDPWMIYLLLSTTDDMDSAQITDDATTGVVVNRGIDAFRQPTLEIQGQAWQNEGGAMVRAPAIYAVNYDVTDAIKPPGWSC